MQYLSICELGLILMLKANELDNTFDKAIKGENSQVGS